MKTFALTKIDTDMTKAVTANKVTFADTKADKNIDPGWSYM